MTPNQSRFRASGFKGFHHPFGSCLGFKERIEAYSFFLFFLFFYYIYFFSSFFLFFLKDSLAFMRCPNTIKEKLSNEPSQNFPKLRRWESFTSYIRDLMCTVCVKLEMEEISSKSKRALIDYQLWKHKTNSKT